MKIRSLTINKVKKIQLLVNKFVCIIFTFGYINISFSQTALNLKEIINLSLKNNFDIRLAEIDQESSAQQNTLGMAGFLPRIYVSASEQFSVSNRDNPTSFINGKISSNNFSPSIGFEQTIFKGFEAQINKSNYDLLQEMSDNNLDLIITNNLKAIHLYYFQIQAQYELIDYQKQILQLSLDLYDYNKEKWNIGIVTTQELNTYEGFVLEDSLSLLSLNNQIIQLESSLSKLCNQNDLKISSITIDKTTLAFNKDSLFNALKNHPNIKSLYLNEQIKANELKKSKTNMYPTIGMSGGYNFNQSNVSIGDNPSISGKTSDYYLGFSLNYNLFNGNKIRTGVKIADYNLEVQNIETQKQEQSLTIDLDTYIKNYDQFQNQFLLSQRLLEVTSKTLEYWKTKQRAGLITSIQLREYQKSHLQNKRNELNQWIQMYQNAVEIQSLTNQLVY